MISAFGARHLVPGTQKNQEITIKPVIKTTAELKKNYSAIAALCKKNKQPVFISEGGKCDIVMIDIETYSRREEDIILGQIMSYLTSPQPPGDPPLSLDDIGQSILDDLAKKPAGKKLASKPKKKAAPAAKKSVKKPVKKKALVKRRK